MGVRGRIWLGVVAVGISTAMLGPTGAGADHSWGSYHWARTSKAFTVSLGSNLKGAWPAHLGTTSTDWSISDVLDTQIVAGQTNPKNCRPTSGRVEVCNSAYGYNGWLGVAQIWVSGAHITQGVVKLNDSYFNTAKYNTPAWRDLVMCQEVGHTLGLGHNDEDFSNPPTGTCMDYSNDPEPNRHPNSHDYEQLGIIYEHLDATTTVASSTSTSNRDIHRQEQWGSAIRHSGEGRPSHYERDLGGGEKVFTFVIWA